MSSETEQPFFSVLIPSYNRPEEIGRTIESILADPCKSVEIIISDDTSPRGDDVRRAVEFYLKHGNIHFYQQPKNLREPNNKNFLIDHARGQYNIIISDDDRFFANALTTLKRYIDENPGYELYGYGYNIVDEHDRSIVTRKSPKKIEISYENPQVMHDMFSADMLPLWLFHPSTFCCKRGVETLLRYHTDVGIGEDLYFIFDFLIRGKKMLIIPEMIFYWRKIQDLQSGQQINQSLAILSDFVARKFMYDKLQNDPKVDPKLHKFLQTKAYRVRFLYNSIIADYRIDESLYTKERLGELSMSEEMIEEFLDYARSDKLTRIRRRHAIGRIFTYLRLVGFKGFLNVIQLLYQRWLNGMHLRRLNAS